MVGTLGNHTEVVIKTLIVRNISQGFLVVKTVLRINKMLVYHVSSTIPLLKAYYHVHFLC